MRSTIGTGPAKDRPRKTGFAVRFVLIAVVGLGLLLAASVKLAFDHDIQGEYQRITGKTEEWISPVGKIQYAVRKGDGPGLPVLIVHGSGGGFDQALFLAELALPPGRTAVCPSRFGYLGSEVPPDASAVSQADALDALMHHLGYPRYHVLGMSAGGATSAQIALRHPSSVTGLVLVSCGLVAQPTPAAKGSNAQGDALASIVSNDFLYWAFTKTLRPTFIEFVGVPAPVYAKLSPAEQNLVTRMIEEMNPAAPRAPGIAVDRAQALPGQGLRDILVPTLLFHAQDDTLQLYGNSRDAALLIPNSELITFPSGGHAVLGLQRQRIEGRTTTFLRAAEEGILR